MVKLQISLIYNKHDKGPNTTLNNKEPHCILLESMSGIVENIALANDFQVIWKPLKFITSNAVNVQIFCL